jgi:hypothetical protein
MPKIATTNFGTLALLLVEPEAPVVEKLEFLTNSIESHDGTEERIQLRSKPRRKITYSFFGSFAKNVKANMVATGAIRKNWAIPIWSEAQYIGSVATNITGTSKTINCTTVNREYFGGKSLALLYRQCNSDYRVIEIDSVSESGITFSHGMQAIDGAYIMPMRVGFVVDSIDYSGNGSNGRYKVNFMITDTFKFDDGVSYDQVYSADFVKNPLLTRGGSYDAKITQLQDMHDEQLGVVAQRSPWVLPKTAKAFQSIANDATEAFALKSMLQKFAGKAKSFWMPTFLPDLSIINAGTVTTELHIYTDLNEFLDYAALRKHVAIRLKDGTWIAREITNKLAWTGGRVRIILDSSIATDAANIDLVCYLTKCRLASDNFELSTAQGITSCSVNIMEIEQ